MTSMQVASGFRARRKSACENRLGAADANEGASKTTCVKPVWSGSTSTSLMRFDRLAAVRSGHDRRLAGAPRAGPR